MMMTFLPITAVPREQEYAHIFKELRVFTSRSISTWMIPPNQFATSVNSLASLFQHVATVIQLCLHKRAQNAAARTDLKPYASANAHLSIYAKT